MVELIRACRPSTIALPHWLDRHPDHTAAAHLVGAAAFSSGLRRFAAPGDAWKPDWLVYYFINTPAEPSLVVDVSEHYEAKRRALDCHVSAEACPMNLVPTASTTAALALGDALAMAVLVEKGFKPEDFASLHPGGTLGKRLMRARQLMHAGDDCPILDQNAPIHVVLDTITRKGLGMTTVVDEARRLTGIITDGDLRRKLAAGLDFRDCVAGSIMTSNPVTVSGETMAVEALALLERRKITSVVVIDEDRRVEGVLHLHDLWRTEMV